MSKNHNQNTTFDEEEEFKEVPIDVQFTFSEVVQENEILKAKFKDADRKLGEAEFMIVQLSRGHEE